MSLNAHRAFRAPALATLHRSCFLVSLPAQLRVAPGRRAARRRRRCELLLRQARQHRARFMQTDAHPDDENNALLAMLGHGQGHADDARHGDARRRRPERDRPGDLRGARRAAHRGAAGGPSLRRRRAVLHARDRLRLLVQRRGDDREVGARRDPRRLRPAHPHDPPRRDRRLPLRRHRRRAAPPGVRAADASKRSARRRIPAKYPEQIKEGLRPWQAKRVFCTDEASFAPGQPAPAPTPRPADA